MKAKRIKDPKSKTFFRSERMIQHAGQWFFSTREGTMQGPFDSHDKALKELEEYVRIMKAHNAGELSIAPKEPMFSI